jgi:hypothetical protein
MSTEILAAGTTAADSSDVVVTAGTPVTVFLKKPTSGPVSSDADFDIKIKSTGAGTYHTIGKLKGREPSIVLDGPGTYRFSRVSASTPTGADKE